MLRLRTKVTASPTTCRRRSSAISATERTSGPRAPNRVTISAAPTSWPSATPARTSATAPPRWGACSGGSPPTSTGGGVSPPEHHEASRARPSASEASSTPKRRAGWSQRSGSRANDGYTVSRGARVCPAASVASRSTSSAGHARSGFTWSAVTGDTPPQSSMPASSSGPRSSDRFGGAWTCTSRGSTRRAAAMAHCRSSGGQASARAMAVPGLGRKFWTMTSCTWPWRPCEAAIARSAASWPRRSSPIPTRIPVVKGMASSPAASSVASRRAGSLSGAPRCAASPSASDSTIIPWLAETSRRRASSSGKSAPALAWGRRPVSSRTRPHISAR